MAAKLVINSLTHNAPLVAYSGATTLQKCPGATNYHKGGLTILNVTSQIGLYLHFFHRFLTSSI